MMIKKDNIILIFAQNLYLPVGGPFLSYKTEEFLHQQ